MSISLSSIKDAKLKFFIVSVVSLVFIIIFSSVGLNYHLSLIKKQKELGDTGREFSRYLNSTKIIISSVRVLSVAKTSTAVRKIQLVKLKDALVELKESKGQLRKRLTAGIENTNQDTKAIFRKTLIGLSTSDQFFQEVSDVVEIGTFNSAKILNQIDDIDLSSFKEMSSTLSSLNQDFLEVLSTTSENLKNVGFALVIFFIGQFILTWLLVFRPLYTTIMKQHEEIVYSMDKIEQANQSRTNFLTNISHEIRTPMTAILGYAEALRDREFDRESIEQNIGIINKNASHLLGLIDEILDISKIESGKFEVYPEKVDVVETLSEVYSMMHVKSNVKGIDLKIRNEGEIPRFVQADKMRLKQVIINLIGNAIKFTQEGGVEVTVLKEKEELLVKVRDTGVGIPDYKRASLFKAFEQVDTSSKRLHQGTGLGLVLSKELAQAMGGDVELEASIEGEGSTFRLVLPCDDYKEEGCVETLSVNLLREGEDAPNEDMDLPSLEGISVLVVDDAKENARLFKMYLQDAGADVHIAHSGDECLNVVEANSIDFIFLDIQMPGKDGYETLKLLRQRNHTGPVAALTAHAMKEERDRTSKAGFDAHVSKPVSGPTLLKTVKFFVSS
jgi:signal transduction histidine kinase/CheY-like chemotaxis protein